MPRGSRRGPPRRDHGRRCGIRRVARWRRYPAAALWRLRRCARRGSRDPATRGRRLASACAGGQQRPILRQEIAPTRRDPSGGRMTVFTIGHSTRSAEEFLGCCRNRASTISSMSGRFPFSRRHPHFNGESLAATLASVGIGYRHRAGAGRAPRPASRRRAVAAYAVARGSLRQLCRLCRDARISCGARWHARLVPDIARR